MSFRLSDLEGRRVFRDGEDLGRLMDVRCRARPGPVDGAGPFAARALVIGAKGWLQRLGLSHHAGLELKPQDIVAVEADRIVMRSAKRAQR